MTVTHTGIKNAIELKFCRKSRTCKGAENGESSQSFFSYVLPVRFVQSSAALLTLETQIETKASTDGQ